MSKPLETLDSVQVFQNESGAIAGIALNLAIAKMMANGNQKLLAITFPILIAIAGFRFYAGGSFNIRPSPLKN